jgi:glycosyltransferase involved in cell wall biosynthesis
MHIGFNSRSLIDEKTRGFSKHLHELIVNLSIDHPEMEISLFSNKKIHEKYLKCYQANVKVYDEPFKSKFIWKYFYLPIKLRKCKVDLFHSIINLGIPPFLKKIGIRSVLTLHDINTEEDMQDFNKLKTFHIYLLYRLSMFFSLGADKVITVSEFSKVMICQRWPFLHNKITVIYNGQKKNREIFTSDSSIKLKEKFLLYVGGMESRKNVLFLIKGFLDFLVTYPKHQQVKLVLAGNLESVVPEIKKYFSNQHLIFIDNPSDSTVEELFEKALFTVHPSMREGFGLQIIESMAAKNAILASDIPPHLEVSNRIGVFFNYNNQDELIKGLLRLIEDDVYREDLSTKGLVYSKKFSWKKMAAETYRVYSQILKE